MWLFIIISILIILFFASIIVYAFYSKDLSDLLKKEYKFHGFYDEKTDKKTKNSNSDSD